MSIIDKNLINRKCQLETTLNKGLKIFNSDKIAFLKMTKVGERSVEFLSEIKGSNVNNYETFIEVEDYNGKFNLKEYFCSCPALKTYGGFCKHLVALAFTIDFEYEDDEVSSFLDENQIGNENNIEYYQKTDSTGYKSIFDDAYNIASIMNNSPVYKGVTSASGRTFSALGASSNKSSAVILKAISDYSSEQRKKYSDNSFKLNVNLEPVIHVENNSLSVEWKIGKEKMYVVKNIENLISAIENRDFVRYGKNLEFVHGKEAFSKEAVRYIEYLSVYNYSLNNNRYSVYSDKRYIFLNENTIDSFIELLKGKSVETYKNNGYKKLNMEVIDKDVKLPVYIKGLLKDNKAELKLPDANIIKGFKSYYIIYEDKLYCCSRKFSDRMKYIEPLFYGNSIRNVPGYYYHFEDKMPSLELCERDYQAFSDTLLPIMEKCMELHVEGVDFSKYEKEEGKYEVYLDLEEYNTVVCKVMAIYGDREHYLSSVADIKETYRDLESEYKLRSIIRAYFPEKASNNKAFILKNNDEALAELVEYGIEEIEQLADVYASEEFKKIKISKLPKITAGLSIKGDLLNVSWDLEGMSGEMLSEILKSYKRKKKYYRLKSGELLNLKDEGLEFLADIQDDFKLSVSDMENGIIELPMYRAMYLEALVQENYSNIIVTRDTVFDNLITNFDNVKNADYKVPDGINAKLRTYQTEGYKWAKTLAQLGFGGILADDMGLGKTLQMITYLKSSMEGISLVVCPASLVYNWENEFNKFAPDMRVCSVVGTAATRKILIESYEQFDVLITSYDLLKRDISTYKNIVFSTQIIDEAQYIKNSSTQAAKAVKAINSKTRFALTGTPVENRLSELWSIFEYLMPGYLFSYKSFKESFEEKIMPGSNSDEQKALQRLHKMISPFIMRRLKKDVLKELPEKIEEVIYAKFEDEQEKIYKVAEKRIISSLKKTSVKDFQENKLQILAEITRLRQICCEPSLVFDNYNKEAAKLTACIDLVENAVSNGHKILLFSQFTSMLDILKEKLVKQRIKVFMLTGATSKKKRRELVESFQEGEADIFLISLKAGGTGLNLTAADVVIHYDPWWNVAAQNQATDRAHRIGQKNTVNVIKLIAKNSIEERILKLQDKKKELADKIISGENTSMSSFTKEELLELFEQ